jgi:quercetin dioxygenase-like cupin family protein
MNVGTLVALVVSAAPVEQAQPVLENAQVAVWDVTWTEGQSSGRWDQDTLMVFLSSGGIEVTESDGKPHVVTHHAGDVDFVPKGGASRRRGISKDAVRSIVIQLKANSPPPLENTSGLPDAFDRPAIEKVLDNERLTVWRYSWELGKRTPAHFHARDVVVVYLANGVLKSTTPDGKSVLNPHSFAYTKFSPRGRIHYEELVEGQARAVLVELK